MSRGSYARKTEVKRDEHRDNGKLQKWTNRTGEPAPEEYHNKSTPVLRASLKHHLACECERYYAARSCSPAIVNAISEGMIKAPGDVLKRNAKALVQRAMKRGLITKGKQ
jgi:hypothetical protein